MAVITRFIVVRNGVELDKVFEDKKEAVAYDNMLDAADHLATFLKQSQLEIEIDPKTIDEISIVLAKNAPRVNQILKGVKPLTTDATKKKATEQTGVEPAGQQADTATPKRGSKPKAERKK